MGQWSAEAIDTWTHLDEKLLQLESLLTVARCDTPKSAWAGQAPELEACSGVAREARLLAEELFRHTRQPYARQPGAEPAKLPMRH
jgi:hypothetical protein